MKSSPTRARRALVLGLAWLAAGLPAAAAEPRIEWSDLQLVDGRVLKASELAGKTVIVEFWASWCPFCKKQNPHFQKLHEASLKNPQLAVLSFTIDKTPAAARDYLAAHGYTFPAALAGAQSERWFGKRKTLPEIYVVDPQGRIVHSELGEVFEEDMAALTRFAR